MERIGDVANSTLVTKVSAADGSKKGSEKVPTPDHTSAMAHVLDFLSSAVSRRVKDEVLGVGEWRGTAETQRLCAQRHWVSESMSRHLGHLPALLLSFTGHRIVHGLDISQPALLTDKVIDTIKQAATLAPLHNPPGLQGISAAINVFGKDKPQVRHSYTTQAL